MLYNNPSYSHILIGSRLWSIRGQMPDWRHCYKVFSLRVLKWRKVLRISTIFYVTVQKVRHKKVLPRHWTGSKCRKRKDKTVSSKKIIQKKFSSSLSWQSSENISNTKLVLVSRKPLLYLEFNKLNKQNVPEINLFKNSTFRSLKITVDTVIDVTNETFLHVKSVKINT